jgi:hypothetical protein
MTKKQKLGVTRTADREKTAVWLDNADLAKLRAIKEKDGIPVNESIRRAVAAYLETK